MMFDSHRSKCRWHIAPDKLWFMGEPEYPHFETHAGRKWHRWLVSPLSLSEAKPLIAVVHIKIPPDQLRRTIGLIWHSTTESTAYCIIIEGTLRVYYSYCMHGTPVTVAAGYPQSTLNGTPTCSSLSCTA